MIAVQAAFGTLLKSTEWLHSDKYSATNHMEMQHYYFDNDWDLISHQGDSPQDQVSPHRHKHHCHSSDQDSNTQDQHRDVPAAPPPATSKGVLADSLELLDPILLSQPLSDPSLGLSEDHLLPNIVSQLCAIHVDNPAQPQPADLVVTLSDQAPHDTDISIHYLIATFLAREQPISNSLLLNTNTPNLDTNLQALLDILASKDKVIDMTSVKGPTHLINVINPIAFTAATDNNPDCLSQSQILQATDCDNFVQAQHSKIKGLENADVFEYHFMSELASLPAGTGLLNAIWSYCHKCKPNGNLSKYKSHICVNSSKQLFGLNYWNTYAPIVHNTVCLMFILLTILGLASCQIDYTQAFLQADLDDLVYMCVPQGWYYDMVTKWLQQFDNPKYVDTTFFIKLKKILHGCKQAAHNWYQHLAKGLLAHGFNQS